jgi:hypothetical protein
MHKPAYHFDKVEYVVLRSSPEKEGASAAADSVR